MPVQDIRQTQVAVFRVLSDDGTAAGYALTPPKDRRFRSIRTLDRARDYVHQLQIHVFRTEEAANAFQAGLAAAGEDSINSIIGKTRNGWAVLREIHCQLDDPHEPGIAVITYDAPPTS